jgi:hypothetical protein
MTDTLSTIYVVLIALWYITGLAAAFIAIDDINARTPAGRVLVALLVLAPMGGFMALIVLGERFVNKGRGL